MWLREPHDEDATLRGVLPRAKTFGQRLKLPVSVPQEERNKYTAFTPRPSAVGLLTAEHNQQLEGGKPTEGMQVSFPEHTQGRVEGRGWMVTSGVPLPWCRAPLTGTALANVHRVGWGEETKATYAS